MFSLGGFLIETKNYAPSWDRYSKRFKGFFSLDFEKLKCFQKIVIFSKELLNLVLTLI